MANPKEPLTLYNSLTKRVEPFLPFRDDQVTIYHCGPTVYKRQHIGNMRRFLFADFLNRTLTTLGYAVKDVTNITDVGHLTEDDLDQGDDKLAKEAEAQATTPQAIAERETQHFLADLDALNIRPSTAYPKATEHIADMQELIQQLLDNDHAYQTETGVYFSVESFPAYGTLSGNTLEKIEAGKRVEVRDEKKHPADFALWIFDDGALQKWDSPWGAGYPGWHIECSAMAKQHLGETIDIHTGGEDNRFPHHENEIAQSTGASGKPFAQFFMHNRHLQLDGAKLAKREGEQITLDTLAERGYSLLAFRLLVFGSHYRKPLDFSWESLDAANENLESVKQLLRRISSPYQGEVARPQAGRRGQGEKATIEKFTAALADDLNTPEALAVVLGYVKEANAQLDAGQADEAEILATLMAFDAVLGIIEPLQQELAAEDIPAEVQQLVDQREEARANGNFTESDRLRDAIAEAGFTVEDTSTGPRIVPTVG